MKSRSMNPCSPREAMSGRERVAVGAVSVASLLAALLALPGEASAGREPLAIVFPPWVSGDEAITRSLSAGYSLLRPGRAPFVVIAAPSGPGQPRAAMPQGALILLTLGGISGCLDAPVADRGAT